MAGQAVQGIGASQGAQVTRVQRSTPRQVFHPAESLLHPGGRDALRARLTQAADQAQTQAHGGRVDSHTWCNRRTRSAPLRRCLICTTIRL